MRCWESVSLSFVLRISPMLMHTSAKWSACVMPMAMYGSLCFRDFVIPIWFFLEFGGSTCPYLSDATNFHIGASANVMHVDACTDGDLMQNRWFFSLFISKIKSVWDTFDFFLLWFYSLIFVWWMKKMHNMLWWIFIDACVECLVLRMPPVHLWQNLFSS